MDIGYAAELFDIFVENSARILRAGFGVDWAEPDFFAAIGVARKYPELKVYILHRVDSTLEMNDPGLLDEGMVPSELVELLAHEMRWIELGDLAEKRVKIKFDGDWSFARGDLSGRIIEALNDDWPDRIFYKHYQK